MAYHWKSLIWVLICILLGTFLIVALHRQQYFISSPAKITPQEKRDSEQIELRRLEEKHKLTANLILKNQKINKQNEEIARLRESITKLESEKLRTTKATMPPSPSPSNSPYRCDTGDVLPNKSQLAAMNHGQLAELYHSYVENIQVMCGHMVRMGSQGDGGWEICDDVTVRPKQPCIVYSVGINNDFTFDDAVARHYGCEIHAFDPSMSIGDYQRSAQVTFHKLGLADYDGLSSKKWKMATLDTIRKRLNHTEKTIDILKVDIEEWEMKVFPEMIRKKALHNVNQFVFETHLSLKQRDGTKERYLTALQILKDLHDVGFRIFFTHRNRFSYYYSKMFKVQRTACHEINMLKVC